MASLEYAALVRPVAPGVQRISALVITILLIVAPLFSTGEINPWLGTQPLTGLIFGLGFLWVGIRQFQRYAVDHFVHNVGATIAGACYLGLLPGMITALLMIQSPDDPHRGHSLVLLAVAACKLGDVAAFFGGRAFGKHKMAPSISPGKTWEGFAASLVGSIGGTYIVLAVLMALGFANPWTGWWQAAIWGLVLGPVGVMGDLWESGIKRDSAAKDSGSMIPGFGGILDVLDAILLAAPVAWLLGQIL
jgi:phosphatidate cytidylyltransferase